MSSYREIDVLDETKPILLVQDTDTRKMYVKKPVPAHNRELYNKLQAFSFSGIPQIHEFCETEEGLFLYEDYISGQILQTVLDDSFNLPEDAAVDIICQLCDILSPLHRCDPPIIHRDIKPSNILLTPSDHVILIDFDASREFDSEKADDTVLLGTHYMIYILSIYITLIGITFFLLQAIKNCSCSTLMNSLLIACIDLTIPVPIPQNCAF